MLRRCLILLCLVMMPVTVHAQTEPPAPRPKVKPVAPKKEKLEPATAPESTDPNAPPQQSGFAIPIFRTNTIPQPDPARQATIITDPLTDSTQPENAPPRCRTFTANDSEQTFGWRLSSSLQLRVCDLWDQRSYTEWSLLSTGTQLPDGRNGSHKMPSLTVRLPRDPWVSNYFTQRNSLPNGMAGFLLGQGVMAPRSTSFGAGTTGTIRQIVVKLDEKLPQTFTVTQENLTDKTNQRIWNTGTAFLHGISQSHPLVNEAGLNAVVDLWRELSAKAVEGEWETARQKNLAAWESVSNDIKTMLEKIPTDQFGKTITLYAITGQRNNQPIYSEKEKTTLIRELNFDFEEFSRDLAHSRFRALRARAFLYQVQQPPMTKEALLAVNENLREIAIDKFIAVNPTMPPSLRLLDDWRYLTERLRKSQERIAEIARFIEQPPDAKFIQPAPAIMAVRTLPQQKYETIDHWRARMDEIIAGVSSLSEEQLQAAAALITKPSNNSDKPRSVGEYLLQAVIGTRFTMTTLGCDFPDVPHVDGKSPLTKDSILNALKTMQKMGQNSLCSCSESYLSNPGFTGIVPFTAYNVFTAPKISEIQTNLKRYLDNLGAKPVAIPLRSPSGVATCPLIGNDH